VHVLTADPTEAARPLIELCNPGDGSLVDPLVGNPRKVQRRFEETFVAPIEALAASLMRGRERRPLADPRSRRLHVQADSSGRPRAG
jgi:hypothetical protein